MCFKQSQKPTLYSLALIIANSFGFFVIQASEIKYTATYLQRLHSTDITVII